jgi:hypothetical protein
MVPGVYSLFWGATAARQEVSTDVFVLQGPQAKDFRNEQDNTFICVLGELCEVELDGVGLQTFNRLKILAYDAPHKAYPPDNVTVANVS